MLKKISNIGDCGIACDFGDEISKDTNKEVIKFFSFVQDSTKAKKVLNWNPEFSFKELVIMMVESDFDKVNKGIKLQ